MTDVLTTGVDLKVARIRRLVKATDLAAQMGVSRATLNRIEGLAGVKPEVAQRYMAALTAFPSVATAQEGPEAA
jgi:DNA-binding Xre family transcriptional regulator